MSMVGELKKELELLSEKHGIEISAVISRNGVPIAWRLPDESQVETFATLSATIVGASEVVYTGLGKEPPSKIVMESSGGIFMAASVSSKALIAILSTGKDTDAVSESLLSASNNIKEVLANEQNRV